MGVVPKLGVATPMAGQAHHPCFRILPAALASGPDTRLTGSAPADMAFGHEQILSQAAF